MAKKVEIIFEAKGFNEVAAGSAKVTASLAKTAVEAGKLDSKLLQTSRATNSASQSLLNLGRVAQDAPFGFIGIANNINPLLESFQRLKVEAGGTRGALKSLGQSLVGGGGLGLALSVVLASVSFITNGFSAWTRGLKSNTEELKKTKDAYDSIISSLVQEQVKIDIIVNSIQKETLTRQQRVNAIKELQKISPAYFSVLNAEKSTVDQVTNAYNNFTKSILASIEIKTREKQLLEITDEILKLKDKGQKFGREEVLINGKLVKVLNSRVETTDKSLTLAEAYNATLRGTIGLTVEENKRLTELEATRKRILDLLTSISDPNRFNSKSPLVKVKEDLDKLNRSILDIKRNITEEFLQLLYGDRKPIIPDFIAPLGLTAEVKVTPKFLIDQEKAKALGAELTLFFTGLANEIGVAFGEALGNAISGTGSIKGIFQSIFATVGAGLQKLGAIFIKSAVLIKNIEKFLIKNPALAIAGGIALVALGSILKNVSAFAVGTRNAPGGLSLVGERGPELMNVPRGAEIVPAAQTANMLGGLQAIEVYGMVRGSDIYFSNKRFGGTLSRNT